MRIFSPFATGLTTIALLAGCSGGTSQAPAINAPLSALNRSVQNSQSAMLRNPMLGVLAPGMDLSKIGATHRTPFVNVAGVNALYGNQTIITDAGSATITVWNGAGQLNAILFDGIAANPNGLATDAAQNLYVANEGLGNVIVYSKPYRSIKLTLDDSNQFTEDVAVSNRGLVGVTNYLTSAYGAGSVSFYAKGTTTACATVKDSAWAKFYFDAFDKSGNLFIDGQNSAGGTLVGEISGGCKATSITTLTVGNTITLPGGVAVYHGKIMIGDPQNQAVYTYAAPSGGSLGNPVATTTLAGATTPITFAMMEGGQNLWTADFNSNTPNAGKYTYPGGSFVKSIDDHLLPIGVAVNPAADP